MNKDRSIHELLKLLLHYLSIYINKKYSGGLCLIVNKIPIKLSENVQLQEYINDNKPFWSYIFRFYSGYFWRKGLIKPRIKWLKRHIKKTQPH